MCKCVYTLFICCYKIYHIYIDYIFDLIMINLASLNRACGGTNPSKPHMAVFYWG